MAKKMKKNKKDKDKKQKLSKNIKAEKYEGDKIIFIYVTCKDEEEAAKIGVQLVEKKLAACINIIPYMHSFYRWKGKLESSKETILLVKTLRSLYKLNEEKIAQMHSYENPCIASIKVSEISQKYQQWLLSGTRS